MRATIFRWTLALLLPALLPGARAAAQTEADTLDVVNWNLEWFCDGRTLDAAEQIASARTIMNGLNADVYALCEIVNVDSLAALAASLNGDYSFVVATYGSFADNPASLDYPGAQKLALVYRTAMVRNVSAGPMMKGSMNSYYNFSSGRYPFLVNADLLGRDGNWRPVAFVVIHAKANSDYSSCQRRSWGARELKDSLDRYMPQANFLFLGDYNDDLNTTICPGGNGISNYLPFLSDSANYKALTLPLSKAGAHSIDGFSTLIDHVIASNEMYRYYVPESAASLEQYVKHLFPDFKDRVSDHFPIRTQFVLDNSMRTSIPAAAAAAARIYPQPAAGTLHVSAPGLKWVQLFATDGRLLMTVDADATGFAQLPVERLPNGLYFLRGRHGSGAADPATMISVQH